MSLNLCKKVFRSITILLNTGEGKNIVNNLKSVQAGGLCFIFRG